MSLETQKQKATDDKSLHIEIVKQMITLSTSGFGLVAALAWNSVIQALVTDYIKKWFPNNSGMISLLIYAIIITILAVFVTLELSKLLKGLENKQVDKST